MKSINFNTGYKEYIINDDENNKIRININDQNIPKRIQEVQTFFDEMSEKYKNEDRKLTPDEMYNLDKQVREKIDYAFGSNICSSAFGNVNCLSPVEGGKMLFEVFFEALLPEVENDIKSMQTANAIHINNKVDNYITEAVKAPTVPQISVASNSEPDISDLSQEQKDAMLLEFIRQGK